MNHVQEVINYIANQPSSTWTTLASYLGGSTLVASVLQVAKHKLNFAGASKLVVFALGFFSFLAAFADLMLQTNAINPLPQLGHVTGLLMAGAVVIHRFAVSPAYYMLSTKAQKFSKLLDEVDQEKKAQPANIPAEVVSTVPLASAVLPDESNLVQFQV